MPLAGGRATVETSGQLEKRVTATRLILTGPFAFGLRKKSDNRQLFLTVEGDGAGFAIEIAPNYEKKAREFAAKVNAEASARATTGDVLPMQDPADQLAKLAALRDQGALTEDEFNTKKSELLDRI